MKFTIQQTNKLQGEITIPGDKSISHRAIMLGALAEGVTIIKGFLTGADCLATLNAFKEMGVEIEETDNQELKIHGVGLRGLAAPRNTIDLGNSGTSMRLMAGILAAQSFASMLTGDASLRSRPMNRVVIPLISMGAKIETAADGKPPLKIQGNPELKSISYQLPIASAQVKSCILLAGLYASGETTVIETEISRDHTERMLRGFGVQLNNRDHAISIQGGQRLKATSISVPGDISSAAFFIVAASIVPESKVMLKNVGVNPTRIGCINILKAMGANIKLQNEREVCGEPVADLSVETAALKGITIPIDQVALAIDEFPILFIAAAVAHGKTILHGAKELRVKESDRIRSMALGLKTLGIQCEEHEDGITIVGGKFSGGVINSFHDHRIAMAFSVAGLLATKSVTITDCENVNTSFPNFVDLLRSLGAAIEVQDE